MQIKRILFWVKCGYEREKVKGKKWHWLAILISSGQENNCNSCKGYRSVLPSPDFSKMGFMGTCSRAVSTLIPPVPAFMGSDAPFVLGELGKRLQGIKGIRGCFSPALSCSLVKNFYFKALAGVSLAAVAGSGVGMHRDAARAQHWFKENPAKIPSVKGDGQGAATAAEKHPPNHLGASPLPPGRCP